MVNITGDIHENITRLMKIIDGAMHGDTIIQLGDAGVNLKNYYNQYPGEDEEHKSKLNSAAEWKGVKILFVYGNHEKRPSTIESYKLKTYCGGQVYVEDDYPALLFAKDGEIFNIEGYTYFVLGGAYSTDCDERTEGRDWWPDEQPSQEIRKEAESNINAAEHKVDFVLSHTCPKKFIPDTPKAKILEEQGEYSTEEWLDSIEEHLQYRAWYCGHWHINATAPDESRMHFLYNAVEEIR